MEKKYVLGVDFGSDSVRALLVDALSGECIGSSVVEYARWKQGLYCDAAKRQFRQHPQDHIDAFISCVKAAGAGYKDKIAAISIDTTGSTVCPTDENGTPLSMLPEFKDEPGAMFYLWKDHTAVSEAEEISRVFSEAVPDYTRYMGPYSSEWYWAKILYAVRNYPFIREHAKGWIEHCDYMANLLAGTLSPDKQYRCSCAAGHKAYWHSSWNGLPDREWLGKLDPYLAYVADSWLTKPEPCTHVLGKITPEWAEKLGLSEDTLISGGSFDAHAGAVGAGVCPGTMVVNIGTSAVNMMVEREEMISDTAFAHIAGIAENSIIPGYIGIETSQAAFGDSFAWLKKLLMWSVEKTIDSAGFIDPETKQRLIRHASDSMFALLQKEAEEAEGEEIPVMLDWFNGRRYPCNRDDALSAMDCINISSRGPQLYRSLAEAVAFGQKLLFRELSRRGVRIENIVAVGGISQKSPFAMQVLCDALQFPVSVSAVEQACAFGAAIYASVAAGIYPDVVSAQKHMCSPCTKTYYPDPSKAEYYEKRFSLYLGLAAKTDPIMKEFL